MTGLPAPVSAPGGPAGLLEKLLAAVRPEFRADVLVFDPADPVFGGVLWLPADAAGPPAMAACVTGIISGGPPRAARSSFPSRPAVRGTATAPCCHAGCPAAASA